VLVRAPDDALLNDLQAAGATEVVPETFEASLMVGSHLLFLLGMPTDDVLRRVRAVRHDRYGMLRALFPGTEDCDPERLELRAVTLPEQARAAGRRLDELGLDREGVRIATLTRDGQREDAPATDTRLSVGDVLVLTGTPAALDRAEVHLLRR
jgi:CPA2 family monovalent cation:H+ antiporter-2